MTDYGVFPACAGVNRDMRQSAARLARVPRLRGGEPST